MSITAENSFIVHMFKNVDWRVATTDEQKAHRDNLWTDDLRLVGEIEGDITYHLCTGNTGNDGTIIHRVREGETPESYEISIK